MAVTRGKKCIVVMIKGNFEEVEKKDTLVERKTRENSLVRVNGGARKNARRMSSPYEISLDVEKWAYV